MKLSLQHVSARYRGEGEVVHALDAISFEQEAGTVLVVVGPSGCGKTTLLGIVAGLVKADSGLVLFDGCPIQGPGPERAVIFQDGALFPWLNVRQNVEFGLRLASVPRAERAIRASAILDKVGLLPFQERAIHELSGGMKQRVAMARALVMAPEMILMDEPLSALDAITREELYVELQGLWREACSTVLFVTHNVREAVVLGDRVMLMSPHPGRILKVYDIDLPKPRRIEDVEVAVLAHEISREMKAAR